LRQELAQDPQFGREGIKLKDNIIDEFDEHRLWHFLEWQGVEDAMPSLFQEVNPMFDLRDMLFGLPLCSPPGSG
jgi:hypothetical protein